jgi:hypothetical protein
MFAANFGLFYKSIYLYNNTLYRVKKKRVQIDIDNQSGLRYLDVCSYNLIQEKTNDIGR